MASTSHQQWNTEVSSLFNVDQKKSLRTTAFRLFEEDTPNEYIQAMIETNVDDQLFFLKNTLDKRDDNLQKTEDLLQYARYIASSTTNALLLTGILDFACGLSMVKNRACWAKVLDHFYFCADVLYDFGTTSSWVPKNGECAKHVLSNLKSLLDKCVAFLSDVTKEKSDILMDFHLCISIFQVKCSRHQDSYQSLKDSIKIFENQKMHDKVSKCLYGRVHYHRAMNFDPHRKLSNLKECFAYLLQVLGSFAKYEKVVAIVYNLICEIATNSLFLDFRELKSFILKKMTSGCRRTRSDLETLPYHLASILLNTALRNEDQVSVHFCVLKSLTLEAPSKNMLPVTFELVLKVIGQNLQRCDGEILTRLVLYAEDLCMLYENHNMYKKYFCFSRLLGSTVSLTQHTIEFNQFSSAVLKTYLSEIQCLEIIKNCTWIFERCSHCFIFLGYYYAEKKMFEECMEVVHKFLETISMYVGEACENLEVAKATAHYLITFSLYHNKKSLEVAKDHIFQEIDVLNKLIPKYNSYILSASACLTFLNCIGIASNGDHSESPIMPQQLQKVIPIYCGPNLR